MREEDGRQFRLLMAGPEEHNAGLIRYAAAMYFHGRGLISAEALEVYRICSPHDREDPFTLLEARGLAGQIRLLHTVVSQADKGETPCSP